MRLSINRKVSLAFAVGMVVLALVGSVAYRTTTRLIADAAWARRTHELLDQLDVVAKRLSDAETASRGFALTGDDAQLERYRDAERAVERRMADVRRLVARSAEQRQRLDSLTPIVTARFLALGDIIRARETAGLDSAAELVRTTQGTGVRETLQHRIAAMQAEERAKLEAHDAAVERRADLNTLVIACVALLGLLLAPLGYLLIRRDIKERERAEAALADSELRFRSVAQGASDAIVSAGSAGQITFWNAAAETLFGYSEDEALGQPLQVLMPERHRDTPLEWTVRVGSEGHRLMGKTLERDGRRKDGTEFPIEISMSTWEMDGERCYTIIMRDITARAQAEAALRKETLVDELTGLCNRRGFMTLAEQQLKLARRTKKAALLLYADMNGLKVINDAFGHAEGDAAIARIAEILKSTFRESDVVARLAGDEFVILAVNTADETEEIVMGRLRARLDAYNAKQPYALALSVGAAWFDPNNPRPLADLMAEADARLYERKRRVRSSSMMPA